MSRVTHIRKEDRFLLNEAEYVLNNELEFLKKGKILMINSTENGMRSHSTNETVSTASSSFRRIRIRRSSQAILTVSCPHVARERTSKSR